MKHILIVTDTDPAIKELSALIVKELHKYKVVVLEGSDFAATDILPADACFFGSAKAHCSTFDELARVLKGINLAGRPCGLFSTEAGAAIEWLHDLSRDSELAVHRDALTGTSSSNVVSWVADVLKRS